MRITYSQRLLVALLNKIFALETHHVLPFSNISSGFVMVCHKVGNWDIKSTPKSRHILLREISPPRLCIWCCFCIWKRYLDLV